MAEENSRIKLKQGILAQSKEQLQNGMKVSDMVSGRGRSMDHFKSSNLQNLGKDLMDQSNNSYGGTNFKETQDRINMLKKDRDRTMQQLDNDSDFDEIDQLQHQVDNGYNTDFNKFRDNMRQMATGIRTEKEMNPSEKAQRLSNIRAKMSSYDPSNNNSGKLNYHAAKPILQRKIDQLNGVIKNERYREANDQRKVVLQNMNAKVPTYQNKHNNSVLDNIHRTDRTDHRQPLISNFRKVFS
jgi:hypothetical protein